MEILNERLIETKLTGDIMYKVLNGVIGQMSDGIWENSQNYIKYWTNIAVEKSSDGAIYLKVNESAYIETWKGTVINPFYKMDDFQIKDWFANKLKSIVKIEEKDSNQRFWNRNCTRTLDYLHDVAVRDAYYAYDVLKERNITNKYN